MSGLTLLPAKPGKCPICATKHEPQEPHNQQSLFYQYQFYGEHSRWPTWADAMAHCDDEMKLLWERELRARDAWSEPESKPDEVEA